MNGAALHGEREPSKIAEVLQDSPMGPVCLAWGKCCTGDCCKCILHRVPEVKSAVPRSNNCAALTRLLQPHLCTASSSRSSLPSMRAAASSSLTKRPSQRCQSGPALPAPVAAISTTVAAHCSPERGAGWQAWAARTQCRACSQGSCNPSPTGWQGQQADLPGKMVNLVWDADLEALQGLRQDGSAPWPGPPPGAVWMLGLPLRRGALAAPLKHHQQPTGQSTCPELLTLARTWHCLQSSRRLGPPAGAGVGAGAQPSPWLPGRCDGCQSLWRPLRLHQGHLQARAGVSNRGPAAQKPSG